MIESSSNSAGLWPIESFKKKEQAENKIEKLSSENDVESAKPPSALTTKIIGQALVVLCETNKPVLIKIRKETQKNYPILEATLLNGEVVGRLIYLTIRFKEHIPTGIKEGLFFNEGYGYQKNQEKINRLVVEKLESHPHNKRYKGIGTALMQAVLEKEEGKVELWASLSSHGFYYKLGMRACCLKNELKAAQINEKIRLELEKSKEENREPSTSHLGCVTMYMPPEGQKTWKKRMQSFPVLC